MKAALLLAPALLAGCAAQAPGPEAAARADRRLAEATRGRVPGKPVTCISTLGLQGPDRIDATTLAYRSGASQLWLARLPDACPGIDDPDTILAVRQFNGAQLCRNDTFQLIHRTGGLPRGGLCRFGDFVPYTKTR